MTTTKPVFVFGSNEAGHHIGGAALHAYKNNLGARWGMSFGHYGQSFAIPTLTADLRKLSLLNIKTYVDGFLLYAKSKPDLTFQVTQIGCGIAGFRAEDIAPMFFYASQNVQFDEAWKPYLGEAVNYWGTHP